MKSELLPLQLLEAGVHRFITKCSNSAELERAIRAIHIHSGQRYLNPNIATQLALRKASGNSPFSQLSK